MTMTARKERKSIEFFEAARKWVCEAEWESNNECMRKTRIMSNDHWINFGFLYFTLIEVVNLTYGTVFIRSRLCVRTVRWAVLCVRTTKQYLNHESFGRPFNELCSKYKKTKWIEWFCFFLLSLNKLPTTKSILHEFWFFGEVSHPTS